MDGQLKYNLLLLKLGRPVPWESLPVGFHGKVVAVIKERTVVVEVLKTNPIPQPMGDQITPEEVYPEATGEKKVEPELIFVNNLDVSVEVGDRIGMVSVKNGTANEKLYVVVNNQSWIST